MKLLQKITAKELAMMQDSHINTAYGDLKEIRSELNVKNVRLIHYLIWIRVVDPIDLLSNLDDLDKDIIQELVS